MIFHQYELERLGHSFEQYIEEFDDNVSANREFSNWSFDLSGDGWTKKQKDTAEQSLQIYTEGQSKKRVLYQDRKQWRNYAQCWVMMRINHLRISGE